MYVCKRCYQHLNLNLNSLLVSRQMTLFHQGVRIRLRTNQNLATELDLAIVAKRSFKNCAYFIYVLLNFKIVKKLQANTRLKLLTALNLYFV